MTPVTDPNPTAPKGAKPKLSYESERSVQWWLANQTEESVSEFNPTFLSSHHERLWILSALQVFYDQKLITDVLAVVKSGKEASVYCCEAHPSTGYTYLAAKIYRPGMFRKLKDDSVYRDSRDVYDKSGKRVRGRKRDAFRKSHRGRAFEMATWIHYEYETQRIVYDAGGQTPRPLSQQGNAMLMEYIGNLGDPAPRLIDVDLPEEAAQPMFAYLLENVRLALRHNRIHGDLSAYNVLYWEGKAQIIDYAQSVDPRLNSDSFMLLKRDIERLYDYFADYGVVANPTDIAANLWSAYMFGA